MKELDILLFYLVQEKKRRVLVHKGYDMTFGYRQQDLRTKGIYAILCRKYTKREKLVISKTSEKFITLIQGKKKKDDDGLNLGSRHESSETWMSLMVEPTEFIHRSHRRC